jgi:hypothetical protein
MAAYSVTDPSGKRHTKRSAARIYTHAVIRQNVEQAGTDYYFVSFASSEAAALKESRVFASKRSYIAVVPTETEEQ